MTTENSYHIATDGTRCVTREVCDEHNKQIEVREQIIAGLKYLSTTRRVTPKVVKTFYFCWTNVCGYKNPLDFFKGHLEPHKWRVMKCVLRRAKANGWSTWRKSDVLYVETPYGQVSWHIWDTWDAHKMIQAHWNKASRDTQRKWSGMRNSDLVIRRLLGEKRVEKELTSYYANAEMVG